MDGEPWSGKCWANRWASRKNRLFCPMCRSKALSLIHIQMCIRDRYLVALLIVGGQEYYDGVRVLGLYQLAQFKTVPVRQVDVQQH